MSLKNIFKKKPKGLVPIQVGNYKILANPEHRLEFYLNNHKYYSRNLPRIAKVLQNKYSTYGIIDIGANIGDTIALIRSVGVDQKIYAIEGDPFYYDMLKKNAANFENVELFETFLGEETGTGNFSLETFDGSANLVQVNSSATQMVKLDEFVVSHKIKNIKLLKVDTDGFDFKILRGSWDFMKLERPVLFFEYDAKYLEKLGENGTDMLVELYNIGYRTALYYDNFGKLLVSVNISDMEALRTLYAYIRNGEGAFHYFDICLFHEDDNELAKQVVKAEMEFFN